MKIRLVFLLILTICAVSQAQPPRGPHPPPKIEAALGVLPEKAVQETILGTLEAIEADDFANFVRYGTEDYKAGLKKEWFDNTVKLNAPRLQIGYNVTYLGDLKRETYTVYMWKLVFADKSDELLGEVGWKNGKMDGFQIH